MRMRGYGVSPCILTATLLFAACDSTGPQDTLESPGGLRAVPSQPGMINLVWSPVSSAEEYAVYRSTGNSGVFDIFAHTPLAALADSTVSHDTTYTYAVCSSNNEGESAKTTRIRCPHPQHGNADIFDAVYRVHSPNGGEVFYVGDVCTVKVTTETDVVGSMLSLTVGGGRYTYVLRDGFNPHGDSVVVFTIEDSVTVRSGPDDIRVSTVSEECLIKVVDYDFAQNNYHDYSDCYFAIRKR